MFKKVKILVIILVLFGILACNKYTDKSLADSLLVDNPLSLSKFDTIMKNPLENSVDVRVNYSEKYRIVPIENSSMGKYILGSKLDKPISHYFNTNEQKLVAIKLFISRINIITIISAYVLENGLQEETSFLADYYNITRMYGDPIKEIIYKETPENSVFLWDTKKAYIIMGYYNKHIYYISLVDKSIVKE